MNFEQYTFFYYVIFLFNSSYFLKTDFSSFTAFEIAILSSERFSSYVPVRLKNYESLRTFFVNLLTLSTLRPFSFYSLKPFDIFTIFVGSTIAFSPDDDFHVLSSPFSNYDETLDKNFLTDFFFFVFSADYFSNLIIFLFFT